VRSGSNLDRAVGGWSAVAGVPPGRLFAFRRQLLRLPMVFIVVTACTLMGERFPEFDAWLEDSKK
jgi:hypothetical protein